jgi:hypothetical protein
VVSCVVVFWCGKTRQLFEIYFEGLLPYRAKRVEEYAAELTGGLFPAVANGKTGGNIK